jgi:hypothetical protein
MPRAVKRTCYDKDTGHNIYLLGFGEQTQVLCSTTELYPQPLATASSPDLIFSIFLFHYFWFLKQGLTV